MFDFAHSVLSIIGTAAKYNSSIKNGEKNFYNVAFLGVEYMSINIVLCAWFYPLEEELRVRSLYISISPHNPAEEV